MSIESHVKLLQISFFNQTAKMINFDKNHTHRNVEFDTAGCNEELICVNFLLMNIKNLGMIIIKFINEINFLKMFIPCNWLHKFIKCFN